MAKRCGLCQVDEFICNVPDSEVVDGGGHVVSFVMWSVVSLREAVIVLRARYLASVILNYVLQPKVLGS